MNKNILISFLLLFPFLFFSEERLPYGSGKSNLLLNIDEKIIIYKNINTIVKGECLCHDAVIINSENDNFNMICYYGADNQIIITLKNIRYESDFYTNDEITITKINLNKLILIINKNIILKNHKESKSIELLKDSKIEIFLNI